MKSPFKKDRTPIRYTLSECLITTFIAAIAGAVFAAVPTDATGDVAYSAFSLAIAVPGAVTIFLVTHFFFGVRFYIWEVMATLVPMTTYQLCVLLSDQHKNMWNALGEPLYGAYVYLIAFLVRSLAGYFRSRWSPYLAVVVFLVTAFASWYIFTSTPIGRE